jgi:hypothetical protein
LLLGNKVFGDELKTGTGLGSTNTTTTDVYVDVAFATVNLGTSSTYVNKVLVVSTFMVEALTNNDRTATFRLVDATNGVYTNGIIRSLERDKGGDKGIGSLVYIYDVSSNSGDAIFKLQHKTSNGSYNNTTSGTIVAVALSPTNSSGENPNGNHLNADVQTLVGPLSAGDGDYSTALTTASLNLPVSGSFYVAASVNNQASTSGTNVGTWKLQQQKNGGTWSDIGKPISRSISNINDEGIASIGLMVTGLSSGTYSFRLQHKCEAGQTIQTLNTNLVAVALAYDDATDGGRTFPAFSKENETGVTNSSVLFNPVESETGTPANNTDMFFYAQYNITADDELNAPSYEMYTTDDASFNYVSQTQQRRLSGASDIGAGGSVGLASGLSIGTEYTASLRQKSDGTVSLTTYNVILSGFQTDDYAVGGYWMGGTIDHLTDWNTDANWANGSVPTSSTNVNIYSKTHNPVISTSADCKNLSVESGATLSIQEAKDLTVAEDLTNSGTFTINSSASGTGSLIVNGTATGTVTMERYIAAAVWGTWNDGWHFVSSPVANYDIELSDFTPAANYDFYAWSEKYNVWVNFKDGADPAFTDADVNGSDDFELGHGYMAAYEDADTKDLTGEINVDDVEVPGLVITGTEPEYRSWHLLGNPFSSGLTWDNTAAWLPVNINGTAEIWNGDGKSYSAITNGGVIPATNGFMVQVSTETGSLTIPKAKRTHGGSFYKMADFPLVKLKAVNLDYPSFQESQLLFNPESTTAYEMEYDGDFLAGYAPLFYSLIDENPMAVNSLPECNESLKIPFTFIKNEGLNFSIEMYEEEGMLLDVWLLDRKTGDRQNLSQNPTYVFTSFEGDALERFEIQFGVVGIEEQNNSASNVQIWAANKTIYILNPDQQKGTLRVINMYGQVLAESQLNGNESQELHVNVTTGNYIVSIVGRQQTISKKVFVK